MRRNGEIVERIAGIARRLVLFNYVPLLLLATVLSFARLIVYAHILDIASFGALSQLLIISGMLAMLGHLGTRQLADREVSRLVYAGFRQRADLAILRVILVVTAVGLICALAGLIGPRPFELSPAAFVAATAHGWSQLLFGTLIFKSRARMDMHRYARDNMLRSLLTFAAGAFAARVTASPVATLLAEIAITLLLVPGLMRQLEPSTLVKWRKLLPLLLKSTADSALWWTSVSLFAASLMNYLSVNLDRWIAAWALDREAFGIYAFAWTAVVAGQQFQFVINASVYPLLSRSYHDHGSRTVLRRTLALSSTALCAGLVSFHIAWFLLDNAIAGWIPKYSGALPLLALLAPAAIVRASDFWTNVPIILGHERSLVISTMIVVGLGSLAFAIWSSTLDGSPSTLMLAQFALALAVCEWIANATVSYIAATRYHRDRP